MSDDKYRITKEKVIDMMLEDRAMAIADGKVQAAISVTKMFGDSIGMYKPAESNNTTNNTFVRPITRHDIEFMATLGMDMVTTRVDPNS